MAKKEENKKNISKEITRNIEKVVVNCGVGKASQKPYFKDKFLPEVKKESVLITGQSPANRPARKSIAGFKLREGDIVGLKTTLRGKRMVDFIVKLINLSLPRVRDFRGIELKNVDKSGNLNIGIKDKQVFPEIDMNKSKVDFGFQINIVPKEKDREEAIDFYRSIGVPLKKD